MKEIIKQFISQIEQDQKLSLNTKIAYKSDLNELINYVVSNNSQLANINHEWVKNYLRYLEGTNKERNSLSRRASTFRLFLKFLYRNRLAPTNYSLIVNNYSTFEKSSDGKIEESDIERIVEETSLRPQDKLILFFISKLGLDATQIVSINTHQIDFENKLINLSDFQKIYLPSEIFLLLRKYLLDIRPSIQGSSDSLNLFLSETGRSVRESDIYKLIKDLSEKLKLENKLTTRSLKKLSREELDILSMQREVLNVISGEI